MEWLEVAKVYAELGILGLVGVLFIVIMYQSFKRNNQKDDEKDRRIDKKDDIYNLPIITTIATAPRCMNELKANAFDAPMATGIECSPFSLSNVSSCNAYMMSKPPHHNTTSIANNRDTVEVVPVTDMYAATGAIPRHMPKTI